VRFGAVQVGLKPDLQHFSLPYIDLENAPARRMGAIRMADWMGIGCFADGAGYDAGIPGFFRHRNILHIRRAGN
jgi:hypothetical protein